MREKYRRGNSVGTERKKEIAMIDELTRKAEWSKKVDGGGGTVTN